MRARVRKFVALLTSVLWLCSLPACSEIGRKAQNSFGGRPGDGGEGVPGYIARLRGLSLSLSAGGTELIASAGTFVASSGTPDQLVVHGFKLASSDLPTLVDADEEAIQVGTPLGSFRPNADGGASALFPALLSPSDVFLLTVAKSGSAPEKIVLSDIRTQLPTAAYRLVGLSSDLFDPVYRNFFHSLEWEDRRLAATAGEASSPRLVVDDEGNQFLVYRQGPSADQIQLFVAQKSPGSSWSAPRLVSGPPARVDEVELAAAGSLVGIAWRENFVALHAVTYAPATGWSEPTVIASGDRVGSPRLAAAPGRLALGYFVSDSGGRRGEVRTHAGGWLPPETVYDENPSSVYLGVVEPHFYQGSGLSVAIWGEGVYGRTYHPSGWLPLFLVTSETTTMVATAADRQGNTLYVWSSPSGPDTEISARLGAPDGTLGPRLSAGTGKVKAASLALDGKFGMVVYERHVVNVGTGTYAKAWREGGWDARETLLTSYEGIRLHHALALDRRLGNGLYVAASPSGDRVLAKRYVVGLGWLDSDSLYEVPASSSLTECAAAFLPDGSAVTAFGDRSAPATTFYSVELQ